MKPQAQIAAELRRHAQDLRNLGLSLQNDSGNPGLDAIRRMDLQATAEAALKLSSQLAAAERKAIGGQLSQDDLESMGSAVDPLIKVLQSATGPKGLRRGSLGESMREIESRQEELRNKRQMHTTAFQNFDQKSNQVMNMLTSVIKTIGEMRGIGAGSRSGL
jgi:hypothetical protein